MYRLGFFYVLGMKKNIFQNNDISTFAWLPRSSAFCRLGFGRFLDSLIHLAPPRTVFRATLFPKHTEDRVSTFIKVIYSTTEFKI